MEHTDPNGGEKPNDSLNPGQAKVPAPTDQMESTMEPPKRVVKRNAEDIPFEQGQIKRPALEDITNTDPNGGEKPNDSLNPEQAKVPAPTDQMESTMEPPKRVVKRNAEDIPFEQGQIKRPALEDITNTLSAEQVKEKEKEEAAPTEKIVEETGPARQEENEVATPLNQENQGATPLNNQENQGATPLNQENQGATPLNQEDQVATPLNNQENQVATPLNNEENQVATPLNNQEDQFVTPLNNQSRPSLDMSASSNAGEPEPVACVVVPIRSLREYLYSEDTFEHYKDPLHDWPYAKEVFEYEKERENSFNMINYMPRQVYLSERKRTKLIDRMVQLQEHFRLFNETLYLAVKIVDRKLCYEEIDREQFQLIGITALLIACKYEEGNALAIEELLDNCDEYYERDDLLEMEREILSDLDYNLGIPISYRFLRRYAHAADIPTPTWILARFILEMSLMDYECVAYSDSQMACAALFMALRIYGDPAVLDGSTWNASLVHFSGYELSDFAYLIPEINYGLSRTDWLTFRAIRCKYPQVCEVPRLTNQELFKDNPELLDEGDAVR